MWGRNGDSSAQKGASTILETPKLQTIPYVADRSAIGQPVGGGCSTVGRSITDSGVSRKESLQLLALMTAAAKAAALFTSFVIVVFKYGVQV